MFPVKLQFLSPKSFLLASWMCRKFAQKGKDDTSTENSKISFFHKLQKISHWCLYQRANLVY